MPKCKKNSLNFFTTDVQQEFDYVQQVIDFVQQVLDYVRQVFDYVSQVFDPGKFFTTISASF